MNRFPGMAGSSSGMTEGSQKVLGFKIPDSTAYSTMETMPPAKPLLYRFNPEYPAPAYSATQGVQESGGQSGGDAVGARHRRQGGGEQQCQLGGRA